MKNKFFALLFFISFSCSLFSQDTIVTIDRKVIAAKILEIYPKEVKYKKSGAPDGPVFTIDISDVNYIRYSNGEKEIYNIPKSSVGVSDLFLKNDELPNNIINVYPFNVFIENFSMSYERFFAHHHLGINVPAFIGFNALPKGSASANYYGEKYFNYQNKLWGAGIDIKYFPAPNAFSLYLGLSFQGGEYSYLLRTSINTGSSYTSTTELKHDYFLNSSMAAGLVFFDKSNFTGCMSGTVGVRSYASGNAFTPNIGVNFALGYSF